MNTEPIASGPRADSVQQHDFPYHSANKTWLLVLLLCLFIVPLLVGTYWMYLESRTEIENRELQGDLVRARTLAAMVDLDITSAETLLTSVADRQALRSSWARRDLLSVESQLQEARKLEPAFLFASVYEPDGTLRAIVPPDRIVGWNFAYRDWYRGVVAHWQPYVSEVYRTTAGSQPLVVAVAIPIRDDNGNPSGILMATYSLAQLSAKFNAIEKGGWEGYVIVDQHGIIAASPEVHSQSEPTRFFLADLVDRVLKGEEGSGKIKIAGENRFVGFAPIPRLGWGAIFQRPESQALAPAIHLKSQHRTISLYLLLIYVATAVFAALLMRRQTRLLGANQQLNRELEKKVAEATNAREDLDRYFMLSIDLMCVAGPDGYFKRVNPAWQKALGWTAEELLSRPYIEFVHPDDRRATVREADLQVQGREAVEFENRYRCKDGSYRWLMWNATPVVDGRYIYAIARDVTDAKQTADALVKAKIEAERSNRFKDQFLSTMSHELRTPLNAVLGFSDLLADARYGSLNERQRRYVSHIHTGGQHLLKLINDVLDISKIEAGRLQLSLDSVPANASLSESIDALRPLADLKSQKLILRASTDLSVRADSTRLRQILTNLIGNAIKFTPERGTIELSTARLGSTVRVDVRDSGPGIPIEEQRRIFDAFYRLQHGEKAAEGTGLGLAITKRLIELHGGYLGVESRPGDGSCFYFTLPVVPTFEPVDPEISAESCRRPPHARILVVEDDPTAMHLLETQLTSAGYEVVLCDDPPQAVAIAAEIQPDAVTLDIVMKPISGWELLVNMKANPITAQIPVVIVTVIDQPSAGALFGADEYVVKPVEKPRLLAALGRCLNKRSRPHERSVLLVEDDVPTHEYITEFLSKQGYSVKTAADGPEARAFVEASLPGLVILDLILPTVSGFQLLAEWRANSRTADLPVVVLTSKDLTSEEKAYLKANASALLNKQEAWKDALLKQLRESLALVPEMKS